MFEVGDKVEAVDGVVRSWPGAPKVMTIKSAHKYGVWISLENHPLNKFAGPLGYALQSKLFKLHTESEAEKRGAKFGATGVVKDKGFRVSFVKERKGLWRVFDENGMDYDFKPSEIRLDHEPEFVVWKDAPEHLKYDASRVYYDGKPVKWIAKPEGWIRSDMVFVAEDGTLRCGDDSLTVKL